MEEELEKELKEIFKIYIRTKQSYESFLNLSEIDKISYFWKHLAFISQKDLFIEIDKLTSKSYNQKFRLTKLFNKLKLGGNFQKFNFSQTKLKEWEDKLTELTSDTEKINTLRSEKYAHSDRGKNEKHKSIQVGFSKFKDLLNLIEDVLKTIYHDCLNKDIEQDINHFLQKINLLKELQEALTILEIRQK